MFPALRSRADLLAILYDLTAHRRTILDACSQLSPAQLNNPVFPGTWHLLKNLAHHCVMRGYTVRFTTASAMLNELALQRRPEPPHQALHPRTGVPRPGRQDHRAIRHVGKRRRLHRGGGVREAVGEEVRP